MNTSTGSRYSSTIGVPGVRMAPCFLVVGIAVAGIARAASPASGDVYDAFFRYTETQHRQLWEGLPSESVDPFTGTLQVVQTDLELRGKGGLDLRIQRVYSSKIWGRTDGADVTSLLAEVPLNSPLGYGWSMHMGRIRDPNAYGGAVSPCASTYPIMEGQDGSFRSFYPTGTTGEFRSRDYWLMVKNCSLPNSERGICVWSPQGIRYEFSSAGQYWAGGDVPTPIWPTSRVVDTNGNMIQVQYDQGALSQVTDSYGRLITFSYSGTGKERRLESMSYGTRVILYGYEAHTGADTMVAGGIPVPGTRRFLVSVAPQSLPGYVWRFEYAIRNPRTQNQYALSKLTAPYGGSVEYTYKPVSFYDGVTTVPFAVVATRTMKDRGGSTIGTWSYDYTVPTSSGSLNVTTIRRPDGLADVHRMYGLAAVTSVGQMWKVGLVQQISRASGLEVETREWDKRASAPIAAAVYSPPAYSECAGAFPRVDTYVYAPVESSITLQRDGLTTHKTTFPDHDDYGQPRRRVESGPDGVGGTTSRTTSFSYFYRPRESADVRNVVIGRPTSQEVCEGSDCLVSTWTYNGPGFLTDTETVAGVKTTFDRHRSDSEGVGNVSQITNGAGERLRLSNYAAGGGEPNTIEFVGAYTFERTATWEGWTKTLRDGRGNTKTWDYDDAGRVKRHDPPGSNAGTTTTYTESTGTVTATRDTGYKLTTTVDGFGRVTRTQDNASSTGYSVTTTRWDAMGRQWFRSDPFTSREVGRKFDFDGLGRVAWLTKGCAPSGGSCSGSDVSTEQYVIQPGNCIDIIEDRLTGNPQKTTTRHCSESFGDPAEGRLVRVRDAKAGEWRYSYDVAGKLAAVQAPLAAGARSYRYDGRRLLTGEKAGELGTVPGDSVSLRWDRDNLGRPLTRKDARAVSWTFHRTSDPLGRLLGITYGSGSPDNSTLSYQIGSNNVSTASSAAGGSYAFTNYDELNRLREQTWTYGGKGFSTSYTYDRAGCLKQIGYPTGAKVDQDCDAANRVIAVRLTPPGGSQTTLVSDVQYHASGQPRTITRPGGLVTDYDLDDRTRVRRIHVAGGTAGNVMDLNYTFDGVDNVVSLNDGAVAGTSRTFEYDELNRLVLAQVAAGTSLWDTTVYDYDALGNRKLRSSGASSANYTYDPRSNRLATAKSYVSMTPMEFKWDLAGHLAWSSDGTAYAYDALGRRILKAEPSMQADAPVTLATVYHYDAAGRVIAETDGTGARLREYVYLGNKLLAVAGCVSNRSQTCNELYWHHPDHLGSVAAMTTAAGQVQRTIYDPWGIVWAADAVTGDRLYNGRVFDSGTGFLDYGARMYWPEIGRFVSADSYPGDPANPASLNRYSYVHNNPYKYTDPTGHFVLALPFLAKAAADAALAAAALVGLVAVADAVAHSPPGRTAAPDTGSSPPPTTGIADATATPPPQVPFDPSFLVPASVAAATATATIIEARNNREQAALIDMAKRDKKTGITAGDAKAYKDLGKGANVPVRGPETHPNRPQGKAPHIHVGPVDHIPVK